MRRTDGKSGQRAPDRNHGQPGYDGLYGFEDFVGAQPPNPEIYAKCAHILLPKDYVRYELTGEFATEVSDASGMQLLDIKNRCWSDEVLEKLDIDKALLAKVYESPEVTGTVTKEARPSPGCAKARR